MKINRYLVLTLFLLLISNFVLLYLLISNKGYNRRKSDARLSITRSLEEEVKFDPSQMKQFQALRETHFKSLRPLYEKLSSDKMELYQLLGKQKPVDSITIERAKEIGRTQSDLDLLIFTNLSEVEGLCRADQKAVYDSAVIRIIAAKWLRNDKNRK